MSAKISKSIHLSAAQWRILVSMMEQFVQSSPDPSVVRIAQLVQKAAAA